MNNRTITLINKQIQRNKQDLQGLKKIQILNFNNRISRVKLHEMNFKI